MTDLSTLLFAAARGARKFQVKCPWTGVIRIVPIDTAVYHHGIGYEVRLRPSDKHLMWGPLSRKYYEAALFGDVSPPQDPAVKTFCGLVIGDIPYSEWFIHYAEADEPTRRMILLTIALALRDEGM